MLLQKLQDDLTTSLKAREQAKVDTLRLAISEIKNAAIDKHGELTDEEIISQMKKMVKKLKESLEMFQTGGREDLVNEHKEQIAILAEYLPAEMTDVEIESAIDDIVVENSDAVKANPKMLMGLVMKQLSSKADAARIMPLLNKKIASL
jgi:uncharacterized protein YqeY